MSAEELKAQGNAAFAAKDFTQAVSLFTQAIEASPTPNHVLYSNRSGSYTSLRQYDEALKDAEECIKINPNWAKGYGRKGAALFGSGDLIGARDAYEQGLKIDPNNAQNKQGIEAVDRAIQAEAEADGTSPDMGMRDLFNDPQALAKLAAHPKTKDFASDPSFIAKFKEIQANPMSGLTAIQHDERLRTAFAVILGIDNIMPQDGAGAAGQQPQQQQQKPKTEETKAEEPVEEPVEEEISEETKLKAQADELKQQGNVAYKSRKFDEAIELYNRAYDTFNDITYLNNRAAAEYEKADYETCINTCLEAVTKGREVFADYTILAKSFGRIGNAYLKMNEHAKAIEYFNKSLTEHRTPDILNKLRATEKELKNYEAMSYIDPVKAEEAREDGNNKFKESDWPGAVKAYSEMIKRAPEDARGYSNRAAALSKLMSFPEAVKDCQTAISKDPKFIRAYIRMANAYFAMREYSKCIDTLADAYELDTEKKHTSEIEQLQYKAMSSRFQSNEGETPEQTLERASRDPEIVAILQDPVMNSILAQARENPSALQDHMKNPQVAKKINLLIAAGIIRTR